MKKSYIAPNFKAKNMMLASFITISNGDNPIIPNDNITNPEQIGAKQNSIFDRVFINDNEE